MNRITFPKYTNLIALIFLTIFKNEINSLELDCNIITHLNESQINIKPIIGVKKCAKDYQDVDIIEKCEYFIDSSKVNATSDSSSLYTPVTNRFKNITYWNEFCAICNYDTELEYWPTWTRFDNLNSACKFDNFEALNGSAADDLRQITRNFIRKGLQLISKSVNSTKLQCSVDENWPINLLQFLIPCLTDQYRRSQESRWMHSCEYKKSNGRLCVDMKLIIEGIDYKLDKKNTVFFDHSLEQKFNQRGYIIESGLHNVMYLCEESHMYEISDWVRISGFIVSAIFIVIYLLLNFTKQYLQSFPNKIIYSYAIGLLVSYLFLLLIDLVFQLLIVGYLFSWLFFYSWTMIMSLEFCRLTYSTFKKRKVTVSSQSKRYFIYCIVGYVIPVVLPVIYFLLLETNEKQCPLLSDHFGIPARPAVKTVAWYFIEVLTYIFVGGTSIVILILFTLQIVVLVYITKCGQTRIRSTAQRNNLIVLMKLGYVMGAHWMVSTFCFLFELFFETQSSVIETADMVSQLFLEFQGVFVFLAFGFKKSWLSGIWYKLRCKKKSTQESISIGTRTTVQFISSSGQLSESTGANE